jgi:Predicted ring-cleavage extradiol dioxygenase
MDEAYITRAPGFRLPAATRLGAVRLQVADLGRSIEYYHEVLGCACSIRTNGAHGSAPLART